MCFGGSKGPTYAPPLKPPQPIHDVIQVKPLPETDLGASGSSPSPNAPEARSTSVETGLNIPV